MATGLSESPSADRQISIPGISPIVPVNDTRAALAFFTRLGFTPRDPITSENEDYILLQHPALPSNSPPCLHLRRAEPGWVEALTNPFGVYIYLPPIQVDEIAEKIGKAKDSADGLGLIEASGKAENKEWGMYEVSINGPDGVLVRVGWPSKP